MVKSQWFYSHTKLKSILFAFYCSICISFLYCNIYMFDINGILWMKNEISISSLLVKWSSKIFEFIVDEWKLLYIWLHERFMKKKFLRVFFLKCVCIIGSVRFFHLALSLLELVHKHGIPVGNKGDRKKERISGMRCIYISPPRPPRTKNLVELSGKTDNNLACLNEFLCLVSWFSIYWSILDCLWPNAIHEIVY